MNNQIYTLFEEDQVLTANHLNELRNYLDQQDRSTRTQLTGVGIVCGLEVENPDAGTIKITGGVGITSRGYLVSIPQTECTHIRKYTDIGTIEPAPGEAEAGTYGPFRNSESGQILLWELVEIPENQAPSPDMYPIDLGDAGTIVDKESGQTVHFNQYCVLLYLEMADEDLEDCFGDDCDENGIRRTLNWRKLLISKTDLENIIRSLRTIGPDVNLADEANICQNLDEAHVERLGYFYDAGKLEAANNNLNDEQRSLSLKNYHRFEHLAADYRSIIEKASVRIGKALHKSYQAYHPLLSDLYPSHPFPDFDISNPNDNGLFKLIAKEVRFKPQVIQYAYDFLQDLVDAYNEFSDVACEVSAVCRPNEALFPRHLMLDLAVPYESPARSPYRHYFRPSPVFDGHHDLKDNMQFLHRRLFKLTEQFKVDIEEDTEVKITPSKSTWADLGERAIPYYYNVDEALTLLRLWNYQLTRRNNYLQISSYHADEYAGRSALQTAMMKYNKSPFLRVEGHIGRKYENVLAEIIELSERLNLPMKVVGVKLSKTFKNTEVNYECRFEDLQELYETFKTEMICLMDEQITFFRNLELKEEEKKEEEKAKENIKKDENNNVFATLEGSVTPLFKGFTSNVESESPYKSPLTGERVYPTSTKTNTPGYIFDNIDIKKHTSGDIQQLALSINPNLLKLNPGQWFFLFLRPTQLVSNIQKMLKEFTERLKDLDLNTLKSAYDLVIQTAVEYKEQLMENTKNGQELDGKEQLIIFRLDKLIFSCSLKKLKELHQIYQNRKIEVQKMNLFSNFAEKHLGLEHMAGVPKGGTLVLVYIDQNEEKIGRNVQEAGLISGIVAGEVKSDIAEKISRISGRTGIREVQSFSKRDKMDIEQNFDLMFKELQHLSVEQGIDIEKSKWTQLFKGVQDKISILPERKIRDIPPDHVVVADFALPYLCRSDCPELATMVISQISLTLPESRFCKKDESKYPFNTNPEGGVIESSAGGVTKEGNTWFFNPSEAAPDNEDVRFTYRVNNQTVVHAVKVFNPKADFDFEVEMLDDGSVEIKFSNNSAGATSFEWDFGDGNTTTALEPVHRYVNVNTDVAVVTLKASKFECVDEAIKQVEIPQEIEVEFRLLNARFENEVYLLCNNDEPYEFLTKPGGKPITGDNSGVIAATNKRFLAPKQYEPGSYNLKYQGETMQVKILPVPAVDFRVEYIERGAQFAQTELINESNGTVVKWVINGEEFTEAQPEYTFKRSSEPYQISLTVTFENGCTKTVERFETIEFGGISDDPDQPDGGSNLIEINIEQWINELDAHKNDELDIEIFDGDNPLYTQMRKYLLWFQDKLQNPGERKKYLDGKLNREIAKAYGDMLSASMDIITKWLQQGAMDVAQYLTGYFKIQITQLLYSVLGQSEDITETGAIGKLIKKTAGQFENLENSQLEIDPDGSFGETITNIKRTALSQGKNNFLRMLE